MAKNSRRVSGSGYVGYKLDFGGAKTSGSVELISVMPVYLVEDTDSGNDAVAEIIGCHRVISAAVTGADGVGNSAVAIGNRLYKDGTEINKDVTNGTFIGYALGVVSSGATTTIDIALV